MKAYKIIGGKHEDHRGVLSFINDFNLTEAKRLYFIEPANKGDVRAWQGHKTEWKYFIAVNGSFTIGLVKVDDWNFPSKNTEVEYFELSSDKSEVLVVPGGYANGIKANSECSKILVLSAYHLEDALDDEVKFKLNTWLFK